MDQQTSTLFFFLATASTSLLKVRARESILHSYEINFMSNLAIWNEKQAVFLHVLEYKQIISETRQCGKLEYCYSQNNIEPTYIFN